MREKIIFSLLAISVLFATGGSTAFGSTIGITTGVFDFVTQPTLDGSMTFVPATNASGQGVGVTNGVAQTYILPPGFKDFAPYSRIGNIIYGNLGTGDSLFAATLDLDALNTPSKGWVQHPEYQITAAGPGGRFGATDSITGLPVEATMTSTGAITNVVHIETTAGGLAGDIYGIYGHTTTGLFDNGVFGQAFCADSGVLRGIGTGPSLGLGVNGATNACLGSMVSGLQDLATSWDTTGNADFFSNLAGDGHFDGEAYSGYGNFTLLRDVTDTNYFINNGVKTMTLPAFCTSFGFQCNADAYLVGSGLNAELLAHGSVIQLSATLTELDRPFENTTTTPEPNPGLLVALALCLLAAVRYRSVLKSKQLVLAAARR